MRSLLALALLLATSAAVQADRLISIPLGSKVTFGSMRWETFAELSRARTWDRYLAVGITKEYEIAYHGERIDDGPMRDTFDFAYQYIAPITDTFPGISVGVQDVLNRTRDGRRAYFAATFRQSLEGLSAPAEVTLGMAQGRHLQAFVGVAFPLHPNFRILAEDNGERIASGVEFLAFDGALGGRILVRDQDLMVGATLTVKF